MEKIENYLIKTTKGTISWKKTAMNILSFLEAQNRPFELDDDLRCPKCGKQVMCNGSEIYCIDEDCSFNPTIVDLAARYLE